MRRPVPKSMRPDVKDTTSTSTDYTVQGSDEIVEVDTSDGPVTVTIPEGLQVGKTITVVDKAGNAGTNNITVQVEGSLSLLGGSSATIDTDYGSARLTVNGDEQVLPIVGGLL